MARTWAASSLSASAQRIEHAALDPDCPPERRLQGTMRLTEALGSALPAHVEFEGRRLHFFDLESGEAIAA